MFAETCPRDEQRQRPGRPAARAGRFPADARCLLGPGHVIATIGCEDMLIIHTPDATLVCCADRAEDIKKVYALVGERFGKEYL